MALMTNAEAFRYDFGFSAIDLWQMKHEQFLKWLNAKCDRERPTDMIVRCKDYRWHENELPGMVYCPVVGWVEEDWYCKGGERKDDAV